MINKRLVYDLAHLQWRPIVLCSNDAKLCYDHIISIASLAMQCLGMLSESIISMFKTIQSIDYLIRIAHGDLKSKLRSSNETTPNQDIL